MKKNILILLMSIFVATSCSDKLDIQSEASLSADMELVESDVDNLLNGLYREVDFPGDVGFFNVMYTEIFSDNYTPVKFQWFQIKSASEHDLLAGDFILHRIYRFAYKAIKRANTIISSESASPHQVGCAKLMRAMLYQRLYDVWESVPLIDENYDNKPIAASSKDDVIKFILSDIDFAIANIKDFSVSDRVNSINLPTKEAAQAFGARVYRIAGNKAKAVELAEAVITSGKFELSPKPSDRSKEVIYQFYNHKGEDLGSHGWIMSPAAKTWNCFAVADGVYNLLKGSDTRKELYYTEAVSGTDFHWTNKYSTDDASELVISRIAEMYLISAEVNANRLTEFQAVRQSSLSLSEERRLELAFEWVRWQDMKIENVATSDYVPPYSTSASDSNPLLKK